MHNDTKRIALSAIISLFELMRILQFMKFLWYCIKIPLAFKIQKGTASPRVPSRQHYYIYTHPYIHVHTCQCIRNRYNEVHIHIRIHMLSIMFATYTHQNYDFY